MAWRNTSVVKDKRRQPLFPRMTVGVPVALTLEEHGTKYHAPTRGYDAIIYTGSGLMGREIENIRSCDVVIFAGGRSGTLGEFAIAYDEAKVIGVLRSTGGIR